jgi:hypothetical protein
LKALTLLNLSQNGNLTDKNPRADLWYILVVLSMCIYQDIVLVSIVTTVLVSTVASVDRPDCAGVVERVQLGPPPLQDLRSVSWSLAG